MSDTNPETTAPVVNTDAARSRFSRHSNKLKALALVALAGTSFAAGRKSKNVRVDVDYVPVAPVDND